MSQMRGVMSDTEQPPTDAQLAEWADPRYVPPREAVPILLAEVQRQALRELDLVIERDDYRRENEQLRAERDALQARVAELEQVALEPHCCQPCDECREDMDDAHDCHVFVVDPVAVDRRRFCAHCGRPEDKRQGGLFGGAP